MYMLSMFSLLFISLPQSHYYLSIYLLLSVLNLKIHFIYIFFIFINKLSLAKQKSLLMEVRKGNIICNSFSTQVDVQVHQSFKVI